MDERKAFLTERSLCFGCYGQNHFSRRCRRKRVCKRCKGPHPTLLHEEGFTRRKEVRSSTEERNPNEETVRVNTVTTNVPQRKSKKKGILLQTILPVIVTQKGTSKSVKTYAFYDNGSSGCFLTENVRNRLEAASTKTQLQLGTMHGQSVVDSAVVKELIVSDPNGSNPIELPRAYTTNKIPVQHEQIPTSEIADRIDHLKEIAGEIPP